MFYTRLAGLMAGAILSGSATMLGYALVNGAGQLLTTAMYGVFWAVVLGVLSETNENACAPPMEYDNDDIE